VDSGVTTNIQVREFFVPRPSYWMLYADYIQMELVMLAGVSQDPILVKVYNERLDIHQKTADQLVLTRQRAKHTNFEIVYQEGAAALCQHIDTTFAEASDVIDRWYKLYEDVADLADQCRRQVLKYGYVTDIFGRRYYINKALAYKGLNAIIQGPCATILKMAHKALAIEFQKRWPKRRRPRQIKTIHDEIGIECPTELCNEELYQLIDTAMTNIPEFTALGVPLRIDIGLATESWAKKKDVWETP
jgi:DNA polymerase-1